MTIAPGTRLGPYEIVAPIGAGGMGEVFRARDTKLGREVAIKVLPAEFARDPERVARFRREAQVLASLHHPNIAAIFGFEESDGILALVLELVDGEDISQRLMRGAIPVDEAINIARQMAEGLEAAHEREIIHRDLKPANVKITTGGAVKILDFGLARAAEGASATNESVKANSPTMARPMTDAGMILGTAAYMSPEQARGKTVDKRSDIWSFGVVLHEMLTGRRLFAGETVSDILAAVLRQDVDLHALPPGTTTSTRRLLARCLERDPHRRLRDIGDARIELERIEQGTAYPSEQIPDRPLPPASRRRRILPWILLGVTSAALVAALAIWAPWRAVPRPAPMRLSARIGTAEKLALAGGMGAALTLSPDGQALAFTASNDPAAKTSQDIFVRRLDQLEATPIPGTDEAQGPFFSPNGQWIAFFAGRQLKKAPAAGGAVVTLCDAPNPRGGTWIDDDTIVFSPRAGGQGLFKISAAGGNPSPFVSPSPGVLTQRWPSALPGGKAILYTENGDITDFDNANLVVAGEGTPPKIVIRGGFHGRYLPSGHLVYVHQGKLMAVRLDLQRLESLGEAVPVLDDVTAETNSGIAQFTVSGNGTLAYIAGAVSGQESPIDWMLQDGTTSPLRATPASWMNPEFSPDGQKLAMDISDGRQRDIFVYEPTTDRLTQLTFDPSNERSPVWSPDGTRITFSSDRANPGIGNLYSIRADGTGGLERLTNSPADQRPGGWDPSGKTLVYEEADRAGSQSVKTLQMVGDAATGLKPGTITLFAPVASTSKNDYITMAALAPTFSPDGRWIAYRGEGGIWVRSSRGPGQWRIPTTPTDEAAGSARFPRWSPNGRELLFLAGSNVEAAPYTVAGNEFRAGTPALWSPAQYQLFGAKDVPFAIHPDGKRLAILARHKEIDAAPDHVVFVFNFFDELQRLLPRGKP